MIAAFFEWVQVKLYFIIGITAGVITAYFRIRKSGKESVQLQTAEKTLQAIKKKEEVKHEVDRLPSGSAAERLRDKWSRD